MSTKRGEPQPKSDSPITGVAAGSLGTAANLDDTQVLRTEELEAAAAAASAEAAPMAPVVAPPAARPRPRPQTRTGSRAALAGVIAFAVLLLIAGSGFVSQLDLGAAAVPTIAAGAPSDAPASGTPAPKAQAAKNHKGCHGHGHGNDCQGSQD